MKLLVCGGRDYKNKERLESYLDDLRETYGIDILIEGGAAGADRLALEWAYSRGIHVATVFAQWDKHGKAAGVKRNYAMAMLRPDLVVAFPGGKGTTNMVLIARKNGLRVFEVDKE